MFLNEVGFRVFLSTRKNLCPVTIDDRVRFLNFLKKRCPHFTEKELSTLLYTLRQNGRKASYFNLLVTTAKDYVEFLTLNKLPHDNKILSLKWIKPEEPIKSVLTDSEIETFLDYRFHNLDWKVFWHVLVFTGARPNEIASLSCEDISLGTSTIIIKHTKTHTPRIIPIPPPCLEMLKELMNKNPTCLFPKVNKKSWNYHFPKIIRELGLEKRPGLSTYSFRHAYISSLVQNDLNIFKIKQFAGHKNIQSTEKYIHLNPDLSGAIYAHPLLRKYARNEMLSTEIRKRLESYLDPLKERVKYRLEEKTNTLYCEIKFRKFANRG